MLPVEVLKFGSSLLAAARSAGRGGRGVPERPIATGTWHHVTSQDADKTPPARLKLLGLSTGTILL